MAKQGRGRLGSQANEMVEGLKIKSRNKKAAAVQIKALYSTFKASDCTMVEVTTLLLFLYDGASCTNY